MSSVPYEKILELRNKILDLIAQQTDLMGNQEGAAIVTSALLEVTLNIMLMHFGPTITEKSVMIALKDFLEKNRAN